MGQIGPRWIDIASMLLQPSPKSARDGSGIAQDGPLLASAWCKMVQDSLFRAVWRKN